MFNFSIIPFNLMAEGVRKMVVGRGYAQLSSRFFYLLSSDWCSSIADPLGLSSQTCLKLSRRSRNLARALDFAKATEYALKCFDFEKGGRASTFSAGCLAISYASGGIFFVNEMMKSASSLNPTLKFVKNFLKLGSVASSLLSKEIVEIHQTWNECQECPNREGELTGQKKASLTAAKWALGEKTMKAIHLLISGCFAGVEAADFIGKKCFGSSVNISFKTRMALKSISIVVGLIRPWMEHIKNTHEQRPRS